MSGRTFFITGATGDLGSELLSHLCQTTNNKIYCLIRDKGNSDYKQRIDEIVEDFAIRNKSIIHPVKGNIEAPQLGLEDNVYQMLTKEITTIIHIASDVRFNLPLELIRKTNVEGTRTCLAFAKACRENNPLFMNFCYTSTTYVAGKSKGLIKEDNLSDSNGFNNTYEQSKWEAETLIREYSNNGLPTIVFRPSIILGYTNGKFKKTNVLYPMIVLQSKYMENTILPYNNRVKMDFVPIDFVAKAIIYISESESHFHKCFHLAAGRDRTMAEGTLGKIMVEELQLKNVAFVPKILFILFIYPYAKFFNKKLYMRIKKLMLMNKLGGYNNYTNEVNPEFDISNTTEALRGSGFDIPDPADVFRACVKFGKKKYVTTK